MQVPSYLTRVDSLDDLILPMRYVPYIFVLVVSALCYAAAFPPLEWPALAWLAPVIWLGSVFDWSARKRFWAMFAVGYGIYAILAFWLTSLFSTLALLLWLIPAFYFGLWGLTIQCFAAKPWQRIVWPAVAWMGIEYFRCELAPLAFSFGGLGYGQVNRLGFSLASIVGVYGVSGCMILTGALAAEGWRNREPGPVWRTCAMAPVVLCMIAAFVPPATPTAQTESLGNVLLQQLRDGDDIGSYQSLPKRRESVDLIVWPELTFASDPRWRQSAWFMDLMRAEAAQAEWGILFGAIDYFTKDTGQNAPYYNTAFYLDTDGEVVATAGKNQPVQLMQDGLPAPDIVVMDMRTTQASALEPVRVGVGICYDGCFQRYSQRMVEKGADFLVFPTMNLEDWGVVQHRQHQRMFQMRAAETGRSVLTAAVSGPTFAAAPGGAVAAGPMPFGETKSLVVDILAPSPTVFNLGGWLVGPLAHLVFVLGVIWRTGVTLGSRFRRR